MPRLFTREDEIELSWTLIDYIMQGWHAPHAPPLQTYPRGSWGPEAADQAAWRRWTCLAAWLRGEWWMSSQLRVYPTRSAAAHAAAAQFVATAEKAMKARGRFTVALAGGNTPRDVYRLLASDEYAPMVEWSNVQIFWGDERCVPFNDPENNATYGARNAARIMCQIAPKNIHRIQSQLPPEEAAQDYEQTLRRYFSARGMSCRALIWCCSA